MVPHACTTEVDVEVGVRAPLAHETVVLHLRAGEHAVRYFAHRADEIPISL